VVTTEPAPVAPTVGLDVGGTKVLGVVIDAGGDILAEHREPTPAGGEAVLAAMAETTRRLRATVPGVVALGAGMPGLVDRQGNLRFAPNLPGVVELPAAARLQELTGLPVRVDNDATCALWGEHVAGVAVGADDVLLVTLGTGIGGGLLLDGHLLRGRNGFAGEPGHMVVDADGIPCPCGRRGCWERYASGSGLGRMGREAAERGSGRRLLELAGGDVDEVRGEHVTEAAAEGDRDAQAVLGHFAGWFAMGLANLVAIVDVGTCVIGGGLVEAGDTLLDPVRDATAASLLGGTHRPQVTILAAALGEHAGAVGAAHLAREALPG
jgi:glucokinase